MADVYQESALTLEEQLCSELSCYMLPLPHPIAERCGRWLGELDGNLGDLMGKLKYQRNGKVMGKTRVLKSERKEHSL